MSDTEPRKHRDYVMVPPEDRTPYEAMQAELAEANRRGHGLYAEPARKALARILIDRGWLPPASAGPKWRVEGTWLCAELDGCTCAASSMVVSGHEPGCGMEPIVDLSTLPGWRVP